MTSLFGRGVRGLVLRTAGRKRVQSWIVRAAKLFDVDLTVAAYQAIGILNYETSERTGEDFLIHELLPRTIVSGSPILLDVGANRGEMSLALRDSFPAARIVAFEPNPITFDTLAANAKGRNIECIRAGLGSSESTGVLHCYRGDPTSGHASMYRDMFKLYEGYGVEGAADLMTFEFPIRTLDEVCEELGIDRIDFLKIDVEGHELEVLKGARGLLAREALSLVQFEFNDCNVLSRTFMRDFYELLAGFRFYRLAPKGLIPLGDYASRLEIFQFQNILAVKDGVDDR